MDLKILISQPLIWAWIGTFLISLACQIYSKRSSLRYIEEKTSNKVKALVSAKAYLSECGIEDIAIERMDNFREVRFVPASGMIAAAPVVVGNTCITAHAMLLHECAKAYSYKKNSGLYKLRAIGYTILYWMTYAAIIAFIVGMILSSIPVVVYGFALPFVLFFAWNVVWMIADMRLHSRVIKTLEGKNILDAHGMQSLLACFIGMSMIGIGTTFTAFPNILKGLKFLVLGNVESPRKRAAAEAAANNKKKKKK